MSEQLTAKDTNAKTEEEAANAAMQEAISAQIDYEELMLVHIGEKKFLIRVKEAEKVVRPQRLTSVPMAPNHLIGVCNIHGLVACIVDPVKVLSLKGELAAIAEHTRFILYKHPRMKVGLQVDSISQVVQIREDLLPVSDGHHNIRGTIEIKGEQYPLLDLNILFQ
ncbi:MAG: chemotaxis protein CheW [Mariprofundaceae bacterium]|nr:chemotaxis protein CheW [Mariprofundaceae bacterium]